MSEFEVWIYRGLIAILLLIIWYLFRTGLKKITDKFDEIILSLNAMSLKNTEQTMAIAQLRDGQKTHEKRLNDHSQRLRKVEIIQAKKQ